MKQTKGNKEPKFRADYVKQYIKRNGLTDEKFFSNLIENQGINPNLNASTFRQYLSGHIQDVPIEI